MCTAITFESSHKENFFGRTMDFSFDIDPHLFVSPAKYCRKNILSHYDFYNDYALMGIGEENDGIFALFDGVNQKGFAMAALYFAGCAKYCESEYDTDKEPIAAFDLVYFMLGRCSCIEDLIQILRDICIVGVPDPVTKIVAPLHWIATDTSGKSVVIEQTERGLQAFYNPIGVMANSPDFEWHMTNLRNYTQVSPMQKKESKWGDVCLAPFGQGAGTVPLPGGYTSPERFTRVAYLKSHMQPPKQKKESVISCFHIMESVSIPKGAVITERNTYDYTKYTAFMNTGTCEYYFKTYQNTQIVTANLCNYKNVGQLVDLGSIHRPVQFQDIGDTQ